MSLEKSKRKFGYTVGAALIAIGAICAIALIVAFLAQVAGKVPTSDHSFGNNGSTTVHVDAGGSKSIYVTNTSSKANINCTIFGNNPNPGPGDVPVLRRYNFDAIPTSPWRARFYFKVKDGGNYRISCYGPSDVRYGVGEYVGVELFTGLFFGIAAGVVLATAGVATFTITAIRRANRSPPPYRA